LLEVEGATKGGKKREERKKGKVKFAQKKEKRESTLVKVILPTPWEETSREIGKGEEWGGKE